MQDITLGTIYEDVAELQEQVAVLQTAVATLQANVNDSGWLELPLGESVTAYNTELLPKYRKIGNEVFLSGVIKGITAANTILATLPVGYRPTRQSYFIGGSATMSDGKASFYNCQVNADGVIRITTHSTATYSGSYYLRLNSSFVIG